MKKTKIIVTVGPSSQDINILKEMIIKGADVVRINLSHASLSFCDDMIKKIRNIEKELNKPIGIMLDTDGPSVRLDKFIEGQAILEEGKNIKLYRYHVICNNTQISVNYDKMLEEIRIGDVLLLSDGRVLLEVMEITNDYALLKVVIGGEIKSNQTIHIKNKSFKMPFISEKDKEGIMYAIKNKIDFLALSYVRSEQDVLEVVDLLIENGNNHINIISKIENSLAIDNLEEIAKVSDGLMVARGDLAIELSIEKLPYFQKMIIKKAIEMEKVSIVATDFLLSMEGNNVPSRSEVSDIYNAVMDKCDAIMLSGETTVGKYPIEVVETLSKTLSSAEEDFDYEENIQDMLRTTKNDITSNIAYSVVSSAMRLHASCIIANTNSGYTAFKISHYKPISSILGLSPSEEATRLMTIHYGVIPILSSECKSTDTIVNMCTRKAVDILNLEGGDVIVITGGFPISNKNTNFMKIEVI